MSHALVTIVAPLRQDRLPDAENLIDALGNPARPDIAAALDELAEDNGTHFTSLVHVINFKSGGLGKIGPHRHDCLEDAVMKR